MQQLAARQSPQGEPSLGQLVPPPQTPPGQSFVQHCVCCMQRAPSSAQVVKGAQEPLKHELLQHWPSRAQRSPEPPHADTQKPNLQLLEQHSPSLEQAWLSGVQQGAPHCCDASATHASSQATSQHDGLVAQTVVAQELHAGSRRLPVAQTS